MGVWLVVGFLKYGVERARALCLFQWRGVGAPRLRCLRLVNFSLSDTSANPKILSYS